MNERKSYYYDGKADCENCYIAKEPFETCIAHQGSCYRPMEDTRESFTFIIVYSLEKELKKGYNIVEVTPMINRIFHKDETSYSDNHDEFEYKYLLKIRGKVDINV